MNDVIQLILIVMSAIYMVIGAISYAKAKKHKDSSRKIQAMIIMDWGFAFSAMSDLIATEPHFPELINWLVIFASAIMILNEMLDYFLGEEKNEY